MNKCNLNKCILFSKIMQGKFSNLWWSVTRWGVFIPINMLNSPSPAAPESLSWNQQSKPFAERNKMHRHQGQARQEPLLLHKSPTSALCWQNVPAAGKWTNFYSLLPGQRCSPWREGELPVASVTVSAQGVSSGSREAALPLYTPRTWRCVGSSSHLAKLCNSSLGIHTELYGLFLSNYCLEGLHSPKDRLMSRKKSSSIYFWL